MKILITVEFFNPHKGGAEKVIEDLATGLVDRGHGVTVATSYLRSRKKMNINGIDLVTFKIKGNYAEGIKGSPDEIKRYQNLLTDDRFDVVFNYAAQSWTTDLTLPVLKNIKGGKILAPVGYSRIKTLLYKKYFTVLPEYLNRYDKLVYHSAFYRDWIYGQENGLSGKAVIVHNGAGEGEFEQAKAFDVRNKLNIRTPHIAITVAHHNIAKGHHFVIKAFKLMKRSDTTLVIIGNRFVSHGIRRVIHFLLDYPYCYVASLFNRRIRLVSGKNRDMVISLYHASDIHLFGSALECAPLVMYESFASRSIFVTRDVGNVGEHEEYIKIVASPKEMAQRANGLLNDDKTRKSLADKAYNLWRDQYTVENLINKYESLFREIARKRN